MSEYNFKKAKDQLVKVLIGQQLNQIHYSYGDVLVLDFGRLTINPNPKLNNLIGEYSLLIKMSSWSCIDKDNLIGQVVEDISLKDNLELIIRFNPSLIEFNVIPDFHERELPYWELWIPGDNIIVAFNKKPKITIKSKSEI